MCKSESACSLTPGKLVKLGTFLSLVVLSVIVLGGQPAWAQIDPPPGGGGGAVCTPGGIDPCASDGNPCTEEFCNPTNNRCDSRPTNPLPASCQPSGGCDPAAENPCGGGSTCTVSVCNPETRQCESAPRVCPSDDNPCTSEVCEPEGGCHSITANPLPDGCQPGGGCDPAAENPCAGEGGDICHVAVCNPETHQCESHPIVCTSDDNPCTSEVCEPEGGCHSIPANPLPDQCQPGGGCDPNAENPCGGEGEGGACTVSVCNPETRECETHPKECSADDNHCTIESCNPETGDCESSDPKSCEGTGEGGQDGDSCTTDTCDPKTGECKSEPTNPPPAGCEGAICRTPGFWGTHAAAATKTRAVNITQAVIAAAGGSLSVCGKTINSTIVSDDNSALEAICVSPAGDIRLQLARQLTAAALNCVMSGGGANCAGTPLYSSIFTNCNAVCGNSGASTSSITSCIGQIDCLNNGGKSLANGYCQTGSCAGDSSVPCSGDANCQDGTKCVPLDSCHLADLVNPSLGLFFEPPGPAGSSTLCNNAHKSGCTVIGKGLTSCTK